MKQFARILCLEYPELHGAIMEIPWEMKFYPTVFPNVKAVPHWGTSILFALINPATQRFSNVAPTTGLCRFFKPGHPWNGQIVSSYTNLYNKESFVRVGGKWRQVDLKNLMPLEKSGLPAFI